MRYQLVATDIDGTLLDHSRTVPESTRAAIQELQRRGIPVVLTTARPPGLLKELSSSLGLTSPIIASTGALVYDPVDNRTLAQRPIPKELVLRVLEVIRRVAPALSMGADLEDEWHLDRIDERLTGSQRLKLMVPILGGLEQSIMASGKQVSCLTFRDPEARPAVEAALRQAGLDQHLYISSAGGITDIVDSRVNKGAALRALAEVLSIPMEQTLALGDDENDIPLLKAAGLGVAMGSAPDYVKSVAGAITAPAWEDGWATAIEQYVFAD